MEGEQQFIEAGEQQNLEGTVPPEVQNTTADEAPLDGQPTLGDATQTTTSLTPLQFAFFYYLVFYVILHRFRQYEKEHEEQLQKIREENAAALQKAKEAAEEELKTFQQERVQMIEERKKQKF